MSSTRTTRPSPPRSHVLVKGVDRTEPKYRSIRESIRESIVTGVYPRGHRLPTEDELGAHFGASRNTVIRALVDLRNDGLLQRVQGAGTFVTDLTSPSRQVFSFIAGGDFDLWTKSTVFGRLEMALGRKLHKHNDGFSLLPDLRRQEGGVEHHRADAIKRACEQGVAGIFLLPSQSHSVAAIDEKLIEERCNGVGIVLLDRDLIAAPRRSRFDLVSLDNFCGGARLGEHLLAQGCRKVVFLVWAIQAEPVKQRLAGLKSVMEEAGAQVRVADGRDATTIRAALKNGNYDAVVGKDDHMAAAAMRVLYELGRRVPDEVKLAGFDDSPLAAELAVPLTTYAQPVEAIADAATQLMLTRIENPLQPAREVIVSGKLVVRRSTASN
jgi:GntR family transcriptional regulator, arabinose operon transcriptional repressor